MTRAVALLRGINVGGRNPIRMADLRACFEAGGFGDVSTYIQSGNVVFTAGHGSGRGPGAEDLALRIEKLLAGRFGFAIPVVVVGGSALRRVVSEAPDGFGADPARYRYDVLFLKPPLRASEAIAQVPVRDGVDEAHPGPGVLYFSRLTARAAQSRLSRVVSLPIYQSMTIRNWNTTTRLLAMAEGDGVRSADGPGKAG